MIQSTSTTMTPITIQVTAVEDMRRLLGRFIAGANLWCGRGEGKRRAQGAAERDGTQIVHLSGLTCDWRHEFKLVIAGHDPAIHPYSQDFFARGWMRGSRPRMTS